MHFKGSNIIVCVDYSGSMASNFSGSTRIKAVGDGLDLMLSHLSKQRNAMVGLVGFNYKPFILKGLSFPSNRELVRTVRSARVAGSTDIFAGLFLSMDLLINRSQCFARQIILLSDGANNSGTSKKNQILAKAQKHSISIYTIGIGDDAYDKKLLMELAHSTGGDFTEVQDLPKMLNTFKRLSSPKHFKPQSAQYKRKIIPFNLFNRRKF
jgi:Ca-activated chloride channel family protein